VSHYRIVRHIILSTLFISGCAPQIEYIPTAPAPRPLTPRRSDEVETYFVTPPIRRHTDLGLIQVFPGSGILSAKEMIETLRRVAGERGCDAVVVTAIDTRGLKDSPAWVEGSCEIYTEPSSEVRPPAP